MHGKLKITPIEKLLTTSAHSHKQYLKRYLEVSTKLSRFIHALNNEYKNRGLAGWHGQTCLSVFVLSCIECDMGYKWSSSKGKPFAITTAQATHTF
ncbi:MAG: hypothetical protein E3K36_05385 [Candidatus Brocadia sp.]|nr:hypothetical protein [Candidatus Brocadia sp.]